MNTKKHSEPPETPFVVNGPVFYHDYLVNELSEMVNICEGKWHCIYIHRPMYKDLIQQLITIFESHNVNSLSELQERLNK